MKNPDVLIIGAGPVGLTMAVQCLKYKIDFRIIEKRTHPSKELRALAIHTRTMELLHFLNLSNIFKTKGRKLNELSLYINKEFKSTLKLNKIDSPYNYTISLDQSETEKILEEHLNKNKIKVERQKELTNLKTTKEIIATIEDTRGKKEKIYPKYLVACDGAHSTVRHKLRLDFPGDKYEEILALADLEVKFPKNYKGFNAYVNDEGIIAFIPLKAKNRYRLISTISPKVKDPTLELMQELSDKRATKGIKLSNPVWMSIFRIHHRIINSFRNGNIFIIGDAAHIHSPMGGQGMNIGMQETENLAWKLSLVLNKKANPRLLDTLDDERYPIAKQIILGTDLSTRIMFSDSFIGKKLKAILFKLLNSSKLIKQKMRTALSEIYINYEDSPIVDENWKSGEGIEKGHRMPDITINGKTKMFNLLKKGKHIILVKGNDKYSEDIKIKYKEIADTHKVNSIPRLGLKNGVYIIRPDGYVGFRSDTLDLNGVKEYFNKLLGQSFQYHSCFHIPHI